MVDLPAYLYWKKYLNILILFIEKKRRIYKYIEINNYSKHLTIN